MFCSCVRQTTPPPPPPCNVSVSGLSIVGEHVKLSHGEVWVRLPAVVLCGVVVSRSLRGRELAKCDKTRRAVKFVLNIARAIESKEGIEGKFTMSPCDSRCSRSWKFSLCVAGAGRRGERREGEGGGGVRVFVRSVLCIVRGG